jgi:hydroxymethylbilane synthase
MEIRRDDGATRAALEAVRDPEAAIALEAERTLVAALGGGCQLPLGAFAALGSTAVELRAAVCSLDGSRSASARMTGPREDPAALGRRVAEELAAAGALDILAAVRGVQGRVEGSY